MTYGKPATVDIYYAAPQCVSSSVESIFVYFPHKPQLQALAHTAGGTAGLTVSEFSLEFPDFASQWLCVPQGGIKMCVTAKVIHAVSAAAPPINSGRRSARRIVSTGTKMNPSQSAWWLYTESATSREWK